MPENLDETRNVVPYENGIDHMHINQKSSEDAQKIFLHLEKEESPRYVLGLTASMEILEEKLLT